MKSAFINSCWIVKEEIKLSQYPGGRRAEKLAYGCKVRRLKEEKGAAAAAGTCAVLRCGGRRRTSRNNQKTINKERHAMCAAAAEHVHARAKHSWSAVTSRGRQRAVWPLQKAPEGKDSLCLALTHTYIHTQTHTYIHTRRQCFTICTENMTFMWTRVWIAVSLLWCLWAITPFFLHSGCSDAEDDLWPLYNGHKRRFQQNVALVVVVFMKKVQDVFIYLFIYLISFT